MLFYFLILLLVPRPLSFDKDISLFPFFVMGSINKIWLLCTFTLYSVILLNILYSFQQIFKWVIECYIHATISTLSKNIFLIIQYWIHQLVFPILRIVCPWIVHFQQSPYYFCLLFWIEKQHFCYFFSDVVVLFVLVKIFLCLLSCHLVLFSLVFKLVVQAKIYLFLVSVAKSCGFFL